MTDLETKTYVFSPASEMQTLTCSSKFNSMTDFMTKTWVSRSLFIWYFLANKLTKNRMFETETYGFIAFLKITGANILSSIYRMTDFMTKTEVDVSPYSLLLWDLAQTDFV